GAMKLREASLTDSIAYHPLEFRHGPTSVVDERTLVILLVSESAREHEAALTHDARALGARVLVIGERTDGLLSDASVELDSGLADYARPVLYLPPIQLLAHDRAISKGLDPDAPRNLSKAVVLTGLEGPDPVRAEG